MRYKASGDLIPSLWSNNDFSNKSVINEPGVYSLIFGSKLPTAKAIGDHVDAEDKLSERIVMPGQTIKRGK